MDETIWMMPVCPAPRVIFRSPNGWPRHAIAAPLTKIGNEDGKPRIAVDGLHEPTARITRVWKKKLRKARAFCDRAFEHVSLTIRALLTLMLTHFVV